MRSLRTIVAALLVLLAVMVVIEQSKPKHFSWKASFAHSSDQPFGARLFDSVMAASLPQGYSVTSLTLSQLGQARQSRSSIYLLLAQESPLSDADERAFLDMLKRGDQFLIAAGGLYNNMLEQEVGFRIGGTPFPFVNNLFNGLDDTVRWVAGGAYGARTWVFPHELSDGVAIVARTDSLKITPLIVRDYMDTRWEYDDDSGWTEVGLDALTDTVAATISHGGNRFVVVSVPFLFTNYGTLYADGATMALRLLAQLDTLPVVRVDPNLRTQEGGVSESPMRYLLGQPPLRWAIYLLLFTIALAMLFTARRRQRVIPVMASPVNRALEMVRHVGTLYFLRHDNADLLLKKYRYFTEEVRKHVMVDLGDEEHIEEAYLLLHRASGIPHDDLRRELQNIVGWTRQQPSDETLTRCIDYLNHILSKLKY